MTRPKEKQPKDRYLLINTKIEQWEYDALQAMAAAERRTVANLVLVLLTPHLMEWRRKHGQREALAEWQHVDLPLQVGGVPPEDADDETDLGDAGRKRVTRRGD